MKRNDYSNYSKGQEISGVTFQQHQNQVIESLNSVMLSLGLDSLEATILYGLENNEVGLGRSFSAGAIFVNGEIFQVNAFTTENALGEIYLTPKTIPVGSPVRFGDGILRAAHNDYKYEMGLTAGVDSLTLNTLSTLKEKLVELVGAEQVANTAVQALIDGATTDYNTLGKLEIATRRAEENTLKAVSNLPFGTKVDMASDGSDTTAVGIVPTYITFSQPYSRIPAAELVIPAGGKRTIKLSCGFWFKKNGDNHVFEISLLYRVGSSGSWITVRTKKMYAQNLNMYATISGIIELTSVPIDSIEFGIKAQTIHADSAAAFNLGLGGHLEFDAIY